MMNAMPTVLFLCTGNYYRSRFAEILFNELAREQGSDWRAVSRGLNIDCPENVGPMSKYTEARLAELGIDCAPYRTMPVQCSLDDLEAATVVVALKEAEHRPMLEKSFGDWAGRVQYWHVHDMDGYTPAEALGEIETLVRKLLIELRSHPDDTTHAAGAAEAPARD